MKRQPKPEQKSIIDAMAGPHVATVSEQQSCKTCRFWHRRPEGNGNYAELCRRYPPTLDRTEIGRKAWPPTLPGDWCGE